MFDLVRGFEERKIGSQGGDNDDDGVENGMPSTRHAPFARHLLNGQSVCWAYVAFQQHAQTQQRKGRKNLAVALGPDARAHKVA